jgi:NADH:ubiquinone oxidoreductase subunit E
MEPLVDVEICTGTTCFVMGAGHLLELAEELPTRLRGVVSISGSHCLGVCNRTDCGRPPFAKVNGELIANASAESLVAACDRVLEGLRGASNETV